MSRSSPHPPLHVRTEAEAARGAEGTYDPPVDIGRGEACAVRVEAEMVSRTHARAVFEDGGWWVTDCDSTNGTFVDGEPIDRCAVREPTTIQLGRDGPRLQLAPAPSSRRADEGPHPGRAGAAGRASGTREEGGQARTAGDTEGGPGTASADGLSVTAYAQKYFAAGGGDGGSHTRRIREAYRRVRTRDRRRMLGGLAVGLLLCLVLAGYALWQHLHTERLRERGRALFAELKKQEVRLAQLRRRVASSGAASLRTRLAALERQHRRQTAQYRGYVRELGVRRELSPKERVIYRVARLFGESEFGIPAGFVRKVKTTIRDYWGGPARDGFVRALRRAREQGYTELIVDTLRAHDLPPELFYLALQESRFDPEAVGPRTRWGIAKGLWQFIPKTARRYGLRLGPRVKRRVPDPKDERHDVRKATRAAADYLQAIYTTRAQASGLLVVASYNWGEHRVVEKMEALPGPQHLPEAALEGIPAEPSARTYWQFLTTYRDRMPAETKDYVLKVFAAAVIGQAPQRFGFSVENPIRRVLNARGNDGAGESAR